MCGIAGLVRTDGSELAPGASAVLGDMAAVLAHRGPDDERLALFGPVGFAFRRLAVVDPQGGAQPLVSDDGDLVLVVNGEIYNHRELAARLPGVRLRTRSDCEVLLHLYRAHGLRFLDDVQGMFALALWDRRRGRLLLGRDRFGVKPLFLHRDGERTAFASELKALFADPATPRSVDWYGALADPLLSATPVLTDAPPTSWFRDIEQVAPGTLLEIVPASGAVREHRYWSLPRPGAGPAAEERAAAATEGRTSADERTAAAFVAGYRELLESSVTACMAADAEIGVFLSGGIDSALVAAIAARTASVHTFTVLSGSTLANGDAEHAHRVAGRLGLPHHQVVFGPERVPDAEEWKRLLWLTETPLCGPEQWYKAELHRYARATRPDLKVILVGQGSDEFNGGYSVGIGGGEWQDFLGGLDQMARRRALHARPALAAWWEHGGPPLLSPRVLSDAVPGLFTDPYAGYVRGKYRDLQQYNCWHEDRTAAGSGTETRVPFLDHRIVELLARIPAALRATLLTDKRILRAAAAGILAPDIAERPKVPFFHGEGRRHAFRTVIAALARDGDALLEEALAAPGAREFLDADAARATLRALEADPEATHVEFLLRLVNLGLLETMAAGFRPAPLRPLELALPETLPVADWDAEADGIAERVAPRPPLDLDLVPAFREDVLLVHAAALDTPWLLLVDGAVEYVLDEDDDPAWLAFVRSMGEGRRLKEVLDRAGLPLEAVREVLLDVVGSGLVTLTPGTPDDSEAAGTAPSQEPA
ncbi:asparagine synthase (glutamine-hydrolyzing) [Streptomyces sp. NPDC012769]|uniref:asparagine synthase (glutamine-hydrolyzing) n=1 Tax=Streptomyces sp. NPDC012769 TaxID=3364848 RepID=UPI0036CA6C26